MAAAPAARSVLPVEAEGLLGTLDTTTSGVHKLVFDTSAGRYSLDGVKSSVEDRRAIKMANGLRTPVFDFDALRLGPATVVSVRGKNPLVILSEGDVALATPLKLDGKTGADNGRGAGGGGGGGGGAVAILARGTLTASSLISVDGGPGGVGNAQWSAIRGGDGGAGGVLLASAKQVEFTGAISALSGGKTTGAQGPVQLVGPVAYGANATINGVAPAKASNVLTRPSVPKGTFEVFGGSGGGGGGGTGLPEVVTPDYVKTMSAGGTAGPGGAVGGDGAYAVAGGAGGLGGNGVLAGGGGGGGGAYSGSGGPGGVSLIGPIWALNLSAVNGGWGYLGGAGACNTASVAGGGTGGTGGVFLALVFGGKGGNGGDSIGGAGTAGTGPSGLHGGVGAGGGGGGGGADGCGWSGPGTGGPGGAGGIGGLAGTPGVWGISNSSFGSGVTITDTSNAIADGVDYDAGCFIGDRQASVGAGNNIPSPGANPNCEVGTYDNSTEVTDLNSVGLSSSGGWWPQLVATFDVDGAMPAAGNTMPPRMGGADLPNNNVFVGFGYKAMFQNPSLQTNTPHVVATRLTGTPIFGLSEHWADGFHFFIGFDVVWTGTHWLHSAKIGTYDPSPEGGFFFDELGTSTAPGVWSDDDPACFPSSDGANWSVTYGPGNSVTVKVDGIVKGSNVQAVGGCVESWYARPGNEITNIKGWATADATVTLPVTIPLSLISVFLIPGFGDITSVGGFIFSSDMTPGNSQSYGLARTEATVSGDFVATPCINEGVRGNRPCVSATGGLIGLTDKLGALATSIVPDTLGDGFRCWTDTFGGLLPPNPMWIADQPCYIDDDNIPVTNGNIDPGERGTFLAEFWDTNYGFTF